MKHDLESLKRALARAPARSLKARLSRLVPFGRVVENSPPDWLYTSGKPNRYNPAGIQCVYFGETKEVAEIEYENQFAGVLARHQAVTVYHADADLRRLLDLTDPATLNALKVDQKELFQNWRRAKRPTVTQLLGKAVNETGLFSAIRYPSAAAVKRNRAGANIVIFRDCVRKPDSVEICGPTRKPLQRWP